MAYEDLEFGPIKIPAELRRVIDLLRKNRNAARQALLITAAFTVALVLRYGYLNIESVIERATAVTLDEAPYEPFMMSPHIMNEAPVASEKFPLKTSHVNWRMQAHNIAFARGVALEYLENAGYLCVHLRHFGVPYDILVFRNGTVMVNPEVEREGQLSVMVQEVSLAGDIARKRRATSLDVTYLDQSLNRQRGSLDQEDAFCFAHYEF